MSEMSQQDEKSVVVKENEIRLVKQPDGNWKAHANVNGNPLEVRDIDPYTCLTRILTHG